MKYVELVKRTIVVVITAILTLIVLGWMLALILRSTMREVPVRSETGMVNSYFYDE